MPAAKKKPLPRAPARTARLNLRIQPDLQEWIHLYAQKTGKSVSGIVVEHFRTLQEAERGLDVEQI